MVIPSRPRRAFWADVRFLIGLALVVLSVAGVWLLVSAARHTDPVLQATRTITPGEELVSGDFRIAEVGLGTLADDYLAPQDLLPGMIADRTIAEGELVPRNATASAESVRTTRIVVESSAGLPQNVGPGTVVELWHAPPVHDGDGYEEPRILVADAIVASLPESEGMLSQRSTALELVIDRADVAAVLSAITGGSVLSAVPTGGSS